MVKCGAVVNSKVFDMPRTKMPRKKSSMKKRGLSLVPSTSEECLASSASSVDDQSKDLIDLKTNVYESPAHFMKAFEAYYEKKVDAHVQRYESCVKFIKDFFLNNILKNYSENYLNLIIHGSDEISEDLNIEPNIKVGSERQSRLQKKEATEFKKPKPPRRTSRKRSLSAPTPAPLPPPPEFRTPLNSARKQMAMIKSITPKVSNTPVSVMRRPQHGEVAFSTSGSPLLIGPVSREDIPTISVPMQDGRVFSILPDPGLPPPDLPDFDEDTKKYLRTLREHLAMLSSP